MKETLSTIMGFVKTNFFKIMGVFLIIGILQYFLGCDIIPLPSQEVETVSLSTLTKVD
jgi:hypothetical protein